VKTIGVGTFQALPKMYDLVAHVLDTGRISYGPMSRQFEREMANIHDCKYAVLSNSGTSSLQVALQAIKEMNGWNDGDEVIVPALTFVATVNVVLHCGLKPVLVDVESTYYGIDCTLIEHAITDRTKAIMPVHTFGQPCDMRYICAIADYHDLKIIEDSCEAMFAKHHGKPAGSWGDVGCFSTYVAHLLTTGVGGIAITDDADLAQVMRSLVNHGITAQSLPEGEAWDPSFLSRKFTFDRIGHSFRITELEVAIGLAQLENYREMLDKRRDNARLLMKGLSPFDDRLQLPTLRPDTEHSWQMFPLVLRDEIKGPLMAYLEEGYIETRDMLPLTCQPCYGGMFNREHYPVADWINISGFYIGVHQGLDENDIDYMVDMIGDYFDRR